MAPNEYGPADTRLLLSSVLISHTVRLMSLVFGGTAMTAGLSGKIDSSHQQRVPLMIVPNKDNRVKPLVVMGAAGFYRAA